MRFCAFPLNIASLSREWTVQDCCRSPYVERESKLGVVYALPGVCRVAPRMWNVNLNYQRRQKNVCVWVAPRMWYVNLNDTVSQHPLQGGKVAPHTGSGNLNGIRIAGKQLLGQGRSPYGEWESKQNRRSHKMAAPVLSHKKNFVRYCSASSNVSKTTLSRRESKAPISKSISAICSLSIM